MKHATRMIDNRKKDRGRPVVRLAEGHQLLIAARAASASRSRMARISAATSK